MKVNSIFFLLIVIIMSLTGCSSNTQDLKASNPVSTVSTQKGDETSAEINKLPALLPTIDDTKNSEDITFTNGYKSEMVENEKYYIVEVGASKSDPKQGVAIIKSISKDGTKTIKEDKILTPEKHGSIKIDSNSINDFNMRVMAEDGFTWILNVFDGFRSETQKK